MSFTDADLKGLKEYWIEKGQGSACDCMTDTKALALLSRLEAAERVIQAHTDLEKDNISYDKFVGLLNAWRKAAGKGEK